MGDLEKRVRALEIMEGNFYSANPYPKGSQAYEQYHQMEISKRLALLELSAVAEEQPTNPKPLKEEL